MQDNESNNLDSWSPSTPVKEVINFDTKSTRERGIIKCAHGGSLVKFCLGEAELYC